MITVNIYEDDSGDIIAVPMAGILRVVLAENPSTGFRWQVEDSSSNCLEAVSSQYFSSKNPVIGSPGTAVFTFKPVKPGRCRLSLKLWRSWEGDKSIVKRFQIIAAITGGRSSRSTD
jgi:inhibitor of cysteine peptidase